MSSKLHLLLASALVLTAANSWAIRTPDTSEDEGESVQKPTTVVAASTEDEDLEIAIALSLSMNGQGGTTPPAANPSVDPNNNNNNNNDTANLVFKIGGLEVTKNSQTRTYAVSNSLGGTAEINPKEIKAQVREATRDISQEAKDEWKKKMKPLEKAFRDMFRKK